MKGRKTVIGTVLVLIGLPAVLAVIEAAHFDVRNRSSGVIISSGQKREYLLYVPSSYDSTRSTPLVISMHGGAMWGAAQRETSRWNDVADRHGFLVVYPSGTEFPKMWHASEPGADLTADVRFISELIDTLEANYNIDASRIYADGFSNGGGMAFVLSCTLSDRIAAVGMVASALFLPWSWCTDQRAVPMIAFHGTDDQIAPYRGGRSWVAPIPFADIPRWTANWARRNRCAPDPVESVVPPDVTRLEYTNCTDDAAVVLYTIIGGGHTWPGGTPPPKWLAGSTSNSVHASSEMWAFFVDHPLRQTRSRARQN
ncbi:MAG: PHB depolymerase family esterase [Gemmatimonadales bacterium]